jgi:hypothetical protein
MTRSWESGDLEPVGARDHARGPKDAPVTLVKYGDYECPYYGELHPILKELQQRVGERVRFVFRHFPLDSEHPRARRAALAAEAAASQGRFWEVHDLLYENQDELGEDDLTRYKISKRAESTDLKTHYLSRHGLSSVLSLASVKPKFSRIASGWLLPSIYYNDIWDLTALLVR